MASFTNLLEVQAPAALRMAKSLLENPALISTTPPWAVSISPENVIQMSEADVSERPVVVPGTETKRFLYDNVAPRPWSWQIDGYIEGNKAVELTNWFTPILSMNVGFLKKAFQNGSRIIYKDVDQWIYPNCVIKSIQLSQKADSKGVQPVSITLQEIKEIKSSFSELTETEAVSVAADASVDLGTTGTSSMGSSKWYEMMTKIGLIS